MLAGIQEDHGADGKTLATKQIIQAWIAECAAEIQAARLMTLNAAWKIEKLGAKAARYDISFIKFFVAGVMQKVIDKALQVHGGMGMTDDTIIAYFYRHETGGQDLRRRGRSPQDDRGQEDPEGLRGQDGSLAYE